MLTAGKRLIDLTAADLMSRDVVCISQPMTARLAAHRLAQAGVSGAPVVDEQGRCVGVLSAIDLVRYLDEGAGGGEGRESRGFQEDESGYCSDWQVVDFEMLPADDVSHFMTTKVVTAHPDTGVGDLARAMLDARIHRIIIVDEDRHPIGIVSSTDVLAAVANEAYREAVLYE